VVRVVHLKSEDVKETNDLQPHFCVRTLFVILLLFHFLTFEIVFVCFQGQHEMVYYFTIK
jgi:hypothetical protein